MLGEAEAARGLKQARVSDLNAHHHRPQGLVKTDFLIPDPWWKESESLQAL